MLAVVRPVLSPDSAGEITKWIFDLPRCIMPARGLLDSVTVVEVTQGYSGYTGKLLSDFGADVRTIEPPGGDRARRRGTHTTAEPHPNASAFYGFLNTGKRSLVVDPDGGTDTVRALCADADVLVVDGSGDYDLSVDALRERFPHLVVVSLDGFGRTGPHAGRESVPLTHAATGGLMSLSGYPDRAPTMPGGAAASYLGYLYGAVGALLALRAREETGEGQVVDVSNQEAVAAHLESENTDYAYNGDVSTRDGNKHALGHPIGTIYPTADGHVCIALFGTFVKGPMGGTDISMWEPFCELIGREDLLEDERFNALPEDDVAGLAKRFEYDDELDAIIEEALTDVSAEEFYREAQEAGIAVSLVTTPPDVYDDPQLEARDFLTDIELPNGDSVRLPGSPFQFSNADVSPDAPPALDEYASEFDASGDEPADPDADADEAVASASADEDEAVEDLLSDLTILDFTQVWAGPCGTKILSDHGADVIKVESRSRPDVIRTSAPLYENEQGDPVHGEDRSGYFQTENRGKRSLAVDLKTDEGRQIILDLVESGEVDVVAESFAPGAMDRLGLDYDTLAERNDSLIMCSISGYGEEGPESGYRAYGAMLGAHSGIATMTGFPGDTPVSTGVAFVDPISGISEAFAILSALRRREETGDGQHIDFAMREAGLMLAHPALSHYDVTGEERPPTGNRDDLGRYVQGCYPCAAESAPDDQEAWLTVSIRDDSDWEALKDVLGTPAWTRDDAFADQQARLRNQDRLDERLAAETETEDRYDLEARLQAAGIPAAVVQTTRDILDNDSHLADRGFWATVDHHVMGEQPYPGALPRLESTPGSVDGPAPMLGQHSREVLYDLLDVTGEEIESLEDAGALE